MDRLDLSGSVDSMIELAEARMRRRLSPYMVEAQTNVTTSDGIGALPGDFGTMVRVRYSNRILDNVAGGAAMNIVQTLTEPYAYGIEGGSLKLWPESDFTVSILYNPRWTGLSSGTPTTALLTSHPDLYFYGTMLGAEGYLANDSRAANFKALFDEALAEAEGYLTRQKYNGPLVPKVAFVP